MFVFNGDIGVLLMVLGVLLLIVGSVVKEVAGLFTAGKICLVCGVVIFVAELLLA